MKLNPIRAAWALYLLVVIASGFLSQCSGRPIIEHGRCLRWQDNTSSPVYTGLDTGSGQRRPSYNLPPENYPNKCHLLECEPGYQVCRKAGAYEDDDATCERVDAQCAAWNCPEPSRYDPATRQCVRDRP